jgi:hypothetical protein
MTTNEWVQTRTEWMKKQALTLIESVATELPRIKKWLEDGDIPLGHVTGARNELAEVVQLMHVLIELVDVAAIASIKTNGGK